MTSNEMTLGDQAIQLCRDIRMSGSLYYAEEVEPLYDRACAIAVLAPEVEDLDRARRIVGEVCAGLDPGRALAGEYDGQDPINIALAAIRFGRAQRNA